MKITAGLHRQVWVSGTSIFVDVHIANNSKRIIKKLELTVERVVLCYRHVGNHTVNACQYTDYIQAAASTLEQSASQARMFQDKEQTILSKSALKYGTGWSGAEAYSTATRTCQVDVPRGHATIKCGTVGFVSCLLTVC